MSSKIIDYDFYYFFFIFNCLFFPIKHTTYTIYTDIMTLQLYNTTNIQYNLNLNQAFPFINKFVYGVIFSGNIFFNV